MLKYKFSPERIAEALLNAGINARELAKKTGISEVSIYKALNGKTAPRNSTMKKICDVLGVEPADVCEMIPDDEEAARKQAARINNYRLPPSEIKRMKTDFDPPTRR